MLHGSKTWALQREGCTPLMANWASNITWRASCADIHGGWAWWAALAAHTTARPHPGLSFLVLEDRTSQSPCS